ncbi:MAG: biotin/lipoyl-binding protein, partial [bacterium]
MKKIQTLPIAACVAISLFALAGCSRDEKTEGSPKPGASPAAGQNVAAAATPVRVAAAREETVTRSVPVTGSIAALQTVVLSPKLSARVEAVAGREGTPVRKGQVVVQQDISDFQIQLQQAEANLQAAISNLTQAQTQVGLQRAASAQGVQDARQQLASANANLALTRNPQRTQEIVVAENNVK